jgi:PII-like signaling protein
VRGLKLTVYFGDRDRAGRVTTARALGDLFARDGVRTAVLLRGVEGFGLKQHLRSHRLLSLSEDLPLVWVAVDAAERILAVAEDVASLIPEGLVTLERARIPEPGEGPEDANGEESSKLTVYCGRGWRSGPRLAYHAVVDRLRDLGVDGASVLLGIDGVRDGRRHRAGLVTRNADMPAMVIAVGGNAAIAAAAADLPQVVPDAVVTLERVRRLKRDGARLAPPQEVPAEDPSGLGVWAKITVFTGEDAASGAGPLYVELVRALREAGVAGVTVLGGVWGYSGAGEPHGDRILSVRRRVPVVAVTVDRPERIARAWPAIDRITAAGGLVTGEMVPAFRATGPGTRIGGLTLADLD